MKPIRFKGCNQVVAKDQPQYKPIPCMYFGDDEGTKLFCWKLTLRERIKVLFTGKIWQFMLTFNRPQTPQSFTLTNPLKGIQTNQDATQP